MLSGGPSPYRSDMTTAIGVGLMVALFICLLLIPFGLPGLWLMAILTLGGLLMGAVGWGTVTVVAAVALVAEAVEFVLVKRLGEKFGASRKAFWGAVAGGMAGLFIGVPIPVAGPVITAFLGTFLGAALVTFMETRSLTAAGRVGTGTLVGRALAAATKVAAGVFILILVGLRLAAM